MSDDLLRVLYHIVSKYPTAVALGGDDELFRDAMRVGREVLIENEHWPVETRSQPHGEWVHSEERRVPPPPPPNHWYMWQRVQPWWRVWRWPHKVFEPERSAR